MSTYEPAVQAAERRGLTVPKEVRQAAAVLAAVAAIQGQVDPDRPALPTAPAAVRQAIAKHAEQIRQAEHERLAANQYADDARRNYNSAVAAAVPGWISGMEKEFQALIKAVTEAVAQLPAELRTDRVRWSDTAVSAPYQRAEAAAVQLDQLVADRTTIARAGGHDGGQDNALYTIAYLPAPSTDAVLAGRWKELGPLLSEWRDLKHHPVARWAHLVRSPEVTLGLATPDEVRLRAAQVQAWRDAEVTRLHGGSVGTALQRVQQSLAG